MRENYRYMFLVWTVPFCPSVVVEYHVVSLVCRILVVGGMVRDTLYVALLLYMQTHRLARLTKYFGFKL